MSYTNVCISEYIACNIFSSLGIPSQETILGTYNGKQVVACKDFEINGFILKDFAHIKNSILSSSENGYGVELYDVLNTINEQSIIPKPELLSFFWNMFIADALLGNFDRHNGNWGFLINRDSGIKTIAPIYDCGSCLYPEANENAMTNILSNSDEIDKRLYTFPSSALRIDNVKINYNHHPGNAGSVTDPLMLYFATFLYLRLFMLLSDISSPAASPDNLFPFPFSSIIST